MGLRTIRQVAAAENVTEYQTRSLIAGEMAAVVEDLVAVEGALFEANRFIIGTGHRHLAIVSPGVKMAGYFGHAASRLHVDTISLGLWPAKARTRTRCPGPSRPPEQL